MLLPRVAAGIGPIGPYRVNAGQCASAAYAYLSEDPGLTTYFFPGRDGVGGWG